MRRFDVYLVALNLDPALGSEMRRTRPCVVVSPDELNFKIQTAIVAPMTSKRGGYPCRVPCRFKGKSGEIVLEQLRTVDQARFVKKLGRINAATGEAVLAVLQEMFAP